MKVSSVALQSNSQNFEGRVWITENLTDELFKQVRKYKPIMDDMIEEKSFDLFIRENRASSLLGIKAQKYSDFKAGNDKFVEHWLPYKYKRGAETLYSDTTRASIKEYEKEYKPKSQLTLKQKLKSFFRNIII